MSIAATTVLSTVDHAAGITTQLLGLAVLAGLIAAVFALAYRSVTDELVPPWLAALAGVSGVAVYLGTAPALEVVIGEGIDPSEVETALFDVGALLAGAGGSLLGRTIGDQFGAEVLRWSPTQNPDGDVSQLAQTVGQVTTVSLPARVDDASGYDPIPDRTKETLEGKKLVFPRTLTVEQLEERLAERLRSDYGVGSVDVEFDADGNVSYLAVGTRAAGIGSTLPPATNAVALRADPGFSASTGDIVQVWDPDSTERVLTGELRGVADDVVTVAVDAGDTPKVDPTRRYRLVTLPVDDRPDREFASLLRAAPETFSTVTVEAGSPLHGLPAGALAPTVTAIRPDGGDPVPFPEDRYRLAPGDLLFVVARPAALRRLETAAEPLDPTLVGADASLPTDDAEPSESIQTADTETTARETATGEDGLPGTGSDDGGVVAGESDSGSFDEIKAQLEGADTSPEKPGEGEASSADTGVTASAGGKSFSDLKSEFESGEADWGQTDTASDDTSSPETESPGTDAGTSDGGPAGDDAPADGADADEDGTDDRSGTEELVGLDEADISLDDTDDDREDTPPDAPAEEEEDELVSLDEAEITFGESARDDDPEADERSPTDPASDDLAGLDFEDDQEDIGDLDLSEEEGIFSDTEETGGEDDEPGDDDGLDDEDDSDDESEADEDDGNSGGGGGKSFAELKEEFESGEADWDDDVSDSPGGDMRLDE